MYSKILNFFEEHFGFSIIGTIITIVFIVSSFIISANTRRANAEQSALQAEATKRNAITIYNDTGEPILIDVGYKITEMVPYLKSKLYCINNDGKTVIDKFLPMGGYIKNTPAQFTGITNNGNRFWTWNMGNLTCTEEEIR